MSNSTRLDLYIAASML